MSNKLEQVNKQIINLGTNQQTTVKEIAEYIIDKTTRIQKLYLNQEPKYLEIMRKS